MPYFSGIFSTFNLVVRKMAMNFNFLFTKEVATVLTKRLGVFCWYFIFATLQVI